MHRFVIACVIIVAGLFAGCNAPSGGGAGSPGASAPTVVAPAY